MVCCEVCREKFEPPKMVPPRTNISKYLDPWSHTHLLDPPLYSLSIADVGRDLETGYHHMVAGLGLVN